MKKGTVHYSGPPRTEKKGTVYIPGRSFFCEGLLAKSAQESPKGAGQYFTPRELIKAIVDVMRPGPDDTVCDPACGTGGFLVAAHDHVVREHGTKLERKRGQSIIPRDTGDS